MAIRQEKYTIYVVPYIETTFVGTPITIFSDKSTSLYIKDPRSTSDCPHIVLSKEIDGQFWMAYYSNNSLDKIRSIYKKLTEQLGEEYVRVEKNVPIDILIKPYA